MARRVGVHRQSVSQWAAELRKKGRVGLKQAGRAGRKPRLSSQQLKKIAHGLKQGPEALGYGTSLWTSARVAHLIERECGVAYHPGHVLATVHPIYGNPKGLAGNFLPVQFAVKYSTESAHLRM